MTMLMTKARGWAGECRRLARAALKLIYREMEVLSEGALAATKGPVGDSQDAKRQAELVCPSATDPPPVGETRPGPPDQPSIFRDRPYGPPLNAPK